MTVSLAPASHLIKIVVITINGDSETGTVSLTLPTITAIIIGESFSGLMRDFTFYVTFLGE